MLNDTLLKRMKANCGGCFPFSGPAKGIYLKYAAMCGILRTWAYPVEQCCRIIIALHFFPTFRSNRDKCGNLIWQNSHIKEMMCLSGY